jgi:predicted O-methyltransferase YrrM
MKKTLNEYVASLNSPLNDSLVPLFKYAKNKKVPIITEEGRLFLLQLIQLTNAKRFLEIGTAIGYNACSIAMNTSCEVVTIERDETMILQAHKNIKALGLSDRITVIEQDALEVDVDTLGTFDMIFIDAAKAQYIKFFERYERLLTAGGVIVTDNLLFHGLINQDVNSRHLRQLLTKIDRFNQYIKTKKGYNTVVYQIGDGMSVSIKRT